MMTSYINEKVDECNHQIRRCEAMRAASLDGVLSGHFLAAANGEADYQPWMGYEIS